MSTTGAGDDGERERIAVVTDGLPGWTLDEVLAALPAHGVAGVEPRLGLGAHLPSGDRAVALARARRIAAAGLTLCGVDATVDHPLGHPELDRVVELAGELGAGFVRIFPPPYQRDRPAEAQLERAAAALRALRRRAAHDLELLIEPCHNSLTPSAELAARVLRESDADGVGVVFDPANMLIEGHLRPEFAIDLLGPWLRHVHVKNLELRWTGAGWHAAASTLDGGHVDWREMLAHLTRAGYDGWVSIDHVSPGAPVDALAIDLATLRQLLVAAPALGDLDDGPAWDGSPVVPS